MSLELNPDGPHSGRYTVGVAQGLAESVRVLNHATFPGAGGLQRPSEVSMVLGNLAAAVYQMPQLLAQLVTFLQRQTEAARVGEDPGGEYGGDAAKAISTLAIAAQNATTAARSLAGQLHRAHAATWGLHTVQVDPPRECVICGCTGTSPCPGGCAWTDAGADLDHQVCSECVGQYAYQVDLWIIGDGSDDEDDEEDDELVDPDCSQTLPAEPTAPPRGGESS